MKVVFIFLTLVVFSAASPKLSLQFDKYMDSFWEEYKSNYGKIYEKEGEELARRLIWERNFHRIRKHNYFTSLGYHSYWLGINKYSDMWISEFRKVLNGVDFSIYVRHNASLVFVDEDVSDLPKEVDWRNNGYVTEVKDQKECGSCWAFATTGSLEGQYFKKSGKLVSLSEQDLIDCTMACQNKGCNGGLVEAAFACIKANGGIESEKDYPYEAKNDKCRFDRKKSITSLKDYVDIERFNEKALQKAVGTIGPVAAAIDASDFGFVHYKEGIYKSNKCNFLNINHGVLVVGYGTENGTDYWIIKNSWGSSWGKNGYMKMQRNNNNMCGIATLATYPLV